MRTNAKGMSLVILVITILVMSILATTVIITLSNNNIINIAQSSVGMDTIANIKEAVNVVYSDLLLENKGINSLVTESAIKERLIASGMDENDVEKLSVNIDGGLTVGQRQTITNTGTITNNGTSLVNYTIKGNSVQNGEPSPNSPVEIQSVGEKTKNYFNIDKVLSSNNVKNDGEGNLLVTAMSTSSGVSATSPKTLKDYAPDLEVGKTYILSATSTGSAKRIYLATSAQVWTFGTSRTITQNDLDSHVVWYANGNGDTTFTAVISDIQIEDGNTATSYEPYGYKIPIIVNDNNETTTYNIYLDEPLRKVGEYEDYIDFESNTLYRVIGKKTTNFQFHNYVENSNVLYLKNTTVFSDKNPNIIAGLSNKILKFTTFPGSTDNNKLMMNGNMYYYCVAATEDEKQTYIDLLENTEIYYVLNESRSNIIDLPEIYTTNGNITITIGTSISPSEVILDYQYK